MNPAELIEIRHTLHRLAELSGRESRTAAYLAEQLEKCRPDRLVTGLGGHGLAAVFGSGAPGPRVLLRCDIDALPLSDGGVAGWAGETEGVSHKCGHDGHMAMLLGLARQLASKPPLAGSAVLLFQPAEETGAGARRVLDDPAFAELACDVALGVHNLPGHALGSVIVRSGPFAAASAGLIVKLTGESSHAAEPEAGRSPVGAVAALVQSVSALPQFETGLGDHAQATVVGIEVGGPAFGTSPGTGRVMITLRADSEAVMERLERRSRELAENLAAAHGLDCELSWTEQFPPTVNDADVVAHVEQAAAAAGMDIVRAERPFAWSEDFGHFTAACPGALVGLGAGIDQPPLHHPDYDFPDRLLPAGVKFWRAALDRLTGHFVPH